MMHGPINIRCTNRFSRRLPWSRVRFHIVAFSGQIVLYHTACCPAVSTRRQMLFRFQQTSLIPYKEPAAQAL